MKRVRIIAGPNGSGKTTCFLNIRKEHTFKIGVYVNADEIENTLREKSQLNFDEYNLKITNEEIQDHFQHSTFSPSKRNEPLLFQSLSISQNIVSVSTTIDSYLAADLAEFIRIHLLKNNISFTFETVMSDSNKITFMKECKAKGYKVYLYFFSTQDPKININRVNIRVFEQGHFVPEDKIISRYKKSLSNLKSAVKNSDKAFIFDNTEDKEKLIVTVENGKDVNRNPDVVVPQWVETYLFQ